jgi:hypothetical protein
VLLCHSTASHTKLFCTAGTYLGKCTVVLSVKAGSTGTSCDVQRATLDVLRDAVRILIELKTVSLPYK